MPASWLPVVKMTGRRLSGLTAEAAWRYCADSAEHVFGGLSGDGIQDRLLASIRDVFPSGLDGAEQHALFGRNVGSARLATARRALERRSLIHTEQEATGGRDRRVSYAVRMNENSRKKDSDELFIRLSSYIRTSPRAATTMPGLVDRDMVNSGSAGQACSYLIGRPGEPCRRCGLPWSEHYPQAGELRDA